MKQSKLLEMAGVISQHIIDGKPEQAREYLRKHPRSVKAIQEYYGALKDYDETKEDAKFWKQHAGIAYDIVRGVRVELKRPVSSLSKQMNAEQSTAIYATDPNANMGHGRTRIVDRTLFEKPQN